MCLCLIKPVLFGKDITEVVVRLGIVRLEGQSPSDQLNRDIVAARLAREHTEKMR